MRIFFCLCVLIPSFALALPEPQLVQIGRAACLLGYAPNSPQRPSVACWQQRSLNDGGLALEKLPSPALREPSTLVAAGRTALCALDRGQVHCFHYGYTDDSSDVEWYEPKRALISERNVQRLWGSSGWSPEFCLERADGSIRCKGAAQWDEPLGEDIRPSDWQTVGMDEYDHVLPSEARPARQFPGSFAIDHYVSCAIGDDRRIRCWANDPNPTVARRSCVEELERSAPNDLRAPGGLALDVAAYLQKDLIHSCRACVQDTDRLVCWGTFAGARADRVYALPGLRAGNVLPTNAALFALETPQTVFATVAEGPNHEVPCVAHEREIYCPRDLQDDTLRPSGAELTNARRTAAPLYLSTFNNGRDFRYCAADEQHLSCDGQLAAHGLVIRPVGLAGVKQSLRAIADHAYRAPAQFLRAAADALERHGDTTEERLFALNAIAPLMENTPSVYFESTALPAFRDLLQTYNRRYGVTAGLRGVPGDHTASALALLHAGIEALRPALPPAAAEKALAAIGSAPTDSTAVAAAIATLHGDLNHAPEALRGVALAIESLGDSLRPPLAGFPPAR